MVSFSIIVFEIVMNEITLSLLRYLRILIFLFFFFLESSIEYRSNSPQNTYFSKNIHEFGIFFTRSSSMGVPVTWCNLCESGYNVVSSSIAGWIGVVDGTLEWGGNNSFCHINLLITDVSHPWQFQVLYHETVSTSKHILHTFFLLFIAPAII